MKTSEFKPMSADEFRKELSKQPIYDEPLPKEDNIAIILLINTIYYRKRLIYIGHVAFACVIPY